MLQTVCAKYEYDGGAGFNTNSKPNTSRPDYFHPSVAGQALIAEVVWNTLGY